MSVLFLTYIAASQKHLLAVRHSQKLTLTPSTYKEHILACFYSPHGSLPSESCREVEIIEKHQVIHLNLLCKSL